jgi:hypothetical protein
MRLLSYVLALIGVALTTVSILCFIISFKLASHPTLTPEFAAKIFESVLAFTVATVLLIAGIVALLYALETKLYKQ